MLANLFSSVLMISIMASAIICVIFITKSIFKDKLSPKWHYYIWVLLFRDNVAGLILMLLNILHWFNPLMWLAANKIREDRELVCDQKALTSIEKDERINYAGTIIKF